MNNKKFKIFLINFIVIVLLIFACEYFCFLKYGSNESKIYKPVLKKESFDKKFEKIIKPEMRKPVCAECTKKPIIILGCSYTYGQFLKEEQTLGAYISEKSKRPVYNFSYPATGVQYAYYVTDKMPKISPEPEYVFYFFINDHIRRMYVNCKKDDDYENLQYDFKSGMPVKKDNRYDIFDNSYLLSVLKNNYIFFYKHSGSSEKLFKQYVYALRNKTKEKYPDAKFVAVLFDENKKWQMPYDIVKELREEGINIIYFSEISDINFGEDKFRLPKEQDSYRHPNELLWNKVSDEIIKRFDL